MTSPIQNHPIISVIVPVFNTGQYLPGCIQSILGQSIANMELILVDDGSSDDSPAIIDGAAAQDNRVKVLHKQNAGQQAAVADGVRMANGDWIAFVDSDDTLPYDALAVLLDNTSDETDIVVGFASPGNGAKSIIPIEEWRMKMLRSDVILCTRWGKLYRRTLFNDDVCYVPADVHVGEDMIMNIKQAFLSESPVTIVNRKIYNYNRHEGSVSSSWVWNLERHDRLYQTVKEAIPPTQMSREYMAAVIQNGVHTLQMVVWKGTWADKKGLPSSDLLKHVQEDIEAWDYHPTKLEEKMLLHHPASTLTRLLVFCNKAIKYGQQFVNHKILKRG